MDEHKDKLNSVINEIKHLLDQLEEVQKSRPVSIAITKLVEASLWLQKAKETS